MIATCPNQVSVEVVLDLSTRTLLSLLPLPPPETYTYYLASLRVFCAYMAPSKSAGAASKKSRTSSIGGASPAAMKQGKLDFSSLKRNASATTSAKEKIVGKVGLESASVKASPAPQSIPVDEDEDDVKQQSETTTPAPSPTLFSSSVAERPSKRAKTAAVPLTKPVSIDIDESSSEEEPEEPVDLDELEKSGKLNRHFGEVRAKMGGMPPGESHLSP